MADWKDDKDAPDRPGAEDDPTSGARQQATDTVIGAVNFGRRSGEQMQSLAMAGTRAYREMTDVSKEDIDVLMQTGNKLAKGVQDMSWEMMQYTQNSWRIGMRAANELMGCRSVEDMMSVSRNFMRDSVEVLLQESARLLEMSTSVASEAITPVSERVQSGEGPRH